MVVNELLTEVDYEKEWIPPVEEEEEVPPEDGEAPEEAPPEDGEAAPEEAPPVDGEAPEEAPVEEEPTPE